MTTPLPNNRHQSRCQRRIKQPLQHQRGRLQIVPVNVDAHETSDNPANRDEQHPEPLEPSSGATRRIPPVQRREQPTAVFPQIAHGEDEGDCEEQGENHAEGGVGAQPADGGVAGRAVEDGAVPDGAVEGGVVGHGGPVVAEDEVAVGDVGEGAVWVEGVVVVGEDGAVEGDAVDDDGV